MTTTGRAIVFPGPQDVELRGYVPPPLRENELLVCTEYSGVSQGTEIWAYTGKRPELSYPTIPGYQAVGPIEAVGPGVTGYSVGQRVLFHTTRLPESYPSTWMGTHVSHAVVPIKAADGHPVVLAEADDPIAASLAYLPAVSLRGIRMVNIEVGDLVVVTGQGLIGQASAQLARVRGATVVATDLSPLRLGLSRRFSADIVVNPSEQDLAEVVRSIKPAGADVLIETTGRSDQFASCIDLLRWEGQLLLQGYYPQPITFDFHATHMKKPTIAVTCGCDSKDAAVCVELTRRGKLRFRELATHVVPVAEAPRLYQRMTQGDATTLGVVFDWGIGR